MSLIDAVRNIVDAMTPEQEAKLLEWMIEQQPQPGAEHLGAPEKWWLGKLRSGELLPGRGWVRRVPVKDIARNYIQEAHSNQEKRDWAVGIRLLRDLVPGLSQVHLGVKVNGQITHALHYEFPGLAECRSHFETMYEKSIWGEAPDSWTPIGLARIRPKRATFTRSGETEFSEVAPVKSLTQ